ncbi:pyroglutamyl-peptidase I [Mycoplasmatota bacterium zrk1]
MKVLVTGFDPFGGESINPAFEVIKKLPNKIENIQIFKLEVPTVFQKAINVTTGKIKEIEPDVIINIGQAGGRYSITPERIAININDASISDNESNQPKNIPIDNNGPAAYFSTLPIRGIVKEINNIGVPASISNTAGTYVCNNLMYGVLNYIHKNNLDIRAGFIHIPFLHEQVVNKRNIASFSIETLLEGIKAAIIACDKYKLDIDDISGEIC